MVAKTVISDIYRDLESRCVTAPLSIAKVAASGKHLGIFAKEQRQYEDSGSSPSQQKFNVWATYTNKAHRLKPALAALLASEAHSQ